MLFRSGHDMSIVNGISRIGFMKGGGKALWKDENIADSITVHAIDFIKHQFERREHYEEKPASKSVLSIKMLEYIVYILFSFLTLIN